ncbi:MAG: response regulator [Gallionellaceae bacterium]
MIDLLIVEDEPDELKSWEQVIEMHNANADELGFRITPAYASSLEEAKGLIASRNYDAAVVDVRLKQENGPTGPNTDGNLVLDALLESEMTVVALFTGEAPLAAKPAWAQKVVEIFRKGGEEDEGTPAVMRWLCAQSPMIKQIKLAHQTIKREMAKVFFHSIWPRWNNWSQPAGTTADFIPTAITRHITSHIYAALLSGGPHGVHPEEWYFVPPLHDKINTGDLVRNSDGSIEIVITPRCDLQRDGKNETIQLATCKDVSVEWEKRCAKITTAELALQNHTLPADDKGIQKYEEAVHQAKDKLRQFTQHSNSNVFHFLPRMKTIDESEMGPFYVQFDKIRSVTRKSDEAMAIQKDHRIASLTSEFLPSLVERLGSYFSRIGTPDYSHPD